MVTTPVTSIAATVAHETMVASLVSSILFSTLLGWTIVMVEASRPLPLALPPYMSKVILIVTILEGFPIGRTLSPFALSTIVGTCSIC